MPKLNTTVDNLELKSNRVTGSTPSASWTDAQYPSAKTLYNAYSSLYENFTSVSARCTNLEAANVSLTETSNNMLNVAHPVGSIMITATKTNPANKVGGTWQLIDREFASSNTTSTDYFTPGANVVEDAVWITRAGHTIRMRVNVTINKEVIDTTGPLIGTFNYNKIGITKAPLNFVGNVTYSDGANCGISWNLHESTGELTLTDVFDLDTLASGNTFCIDMSFPLVDSQMIDSFCDKFYWKRTA